MMRKCIALVIPVKLTEEVTARPQDVRHGTLEALYGPLDCIVSGDWQVYLRGLTAGTSAPTSEPRNCSGKQVCICQKSQEARST